MLGVLEIILAHYAVAGRGRVPRELQIAFIDMRRRPTDLHVRTVALQRAIRLIVVVVLVVMPTAATAATAARFPAPAPLTLHFIIHNDVP